MTKTIQELNCSLQDIAHSGHAQDEIYVKIQDGFYKIKNIQKEIIESNSIEKTVFFIDTEV